MSDTTLMFKDENGNKTPSLNPVTGCLHCCEYCWARALIVDGYLSDTPKYRECGFRPTLHENVLSQPIRGKDKTYSVCLMGDLFGSWVPKEWKDRVLEWCAAADPSNKFMFCTKNPAGYREVDEKYLQRDNFYFGCTIETSREEVATKVSPGAPAPKIRYLEMKTLKIKHKFISIEPILSTTIYIIGWVVSIKPAFVYIGYDNHSQNLDEPPMWVTAEIIRELEQYKVEVRTKSLREAWWFERK